MLGEFNTNNFHAFCSVQWHCNRPNIGYSGYLSWMTTNFLEWSNCVGVYREGACLCRAFWSTSSFDSPKIPLSSADTLNHRQALASKRTSPALGKVLEIVINVVMYNQSRPWNARMFDRLCEQMIAEQFFSVNKEVCHGESIIRSVQTDR